MQMELVNINSTCRMDEGRLSIMIRTNGSFVYMMKVSFLQNCRLELSHRKTRYM